MDIYNYLEEQCSRLNPDTSSSVLSKDAISSKSLISLKKKMHKLSKDDHVAILELIYIYGNEHNDTSGKRMPYDIEWDLIDDKSCLYIELRILPARLVMMMEYYINSLRK